jgi:Zn-dependent metalloprotease
MLNEIIRNGTDEQRDRAIKANEIANSGRTTRAILSALPTVSEALVGITPQIRRFIYDLEGQTQPLPGKLVREEGQREVKDPAVNEAYDGLGKTFQFYYEVYQRNSLDNRGLPLIAIVHSGQKYDNAFWDGQQMVFGDGDGEFFERFTIALDVIAHELTHGVVQTSANLIYWGQSGALNESIADVFGSLVKQFVDKVTAEQATWLIGEGLFTKQVQGKALRSMAEPGTAYDDPKLGKDPQPSHMNNYNYTLADSGGVHINSGIPNRAFYLVATKLGGNAWEKAGRIWYHTLRDRALRPDANFQSFAYLTGIKADQLYGRDSAESQAVRGAWDEVGVTLRPGVAVAPQDGVNIGQITDTYHRLGELLGIA